jgi:hypothetical protein
MFMLGTLIFFVVRRRRNDSAEHSRDGANVLTSELESPDTLLVPPSVVAAPVCLFSYSYD